MCFLSREDPLAFVESWFGGAEFSQLLLVCKAFDSPSYLNEILAGYSNWVVDFSLPSL